MKNEYEYLATILIFGFKGAKAKEYTIFDNELFRQHKHLEVKENSHLSPDSNRLETFRQLIINPNIELRATHVSASEVAQILIFYNPLCKIAISDAIFSDSEFELTGYDWDTMVETRVSKLALLIKTFKDKNIEDLPILINEFPNITNVLFQNESCWRK